MPVSRLLRAAPLAAATLLLAWASSAIAGDRDRTATDDRARSTVAVDERAMQMLRGGGRSAFSVSALHHDGTANHLPPTRHNIELVGELQMNTPANLRINGTEDDPVLPAQIADVAVHKNFAYLNSWAEETCERGGTFIVDISNPAQPVQTGFLPALPERYHGEGAHVVTLDTSAFQGDVLAVNNESCNPPEEDPNGLGGFDLYDVTNPRDPKVLVQGIGDTGPEGELEGDFESALSSHSTFVWQGADRRAYVVFVDNIELTDVDIFEITDPRNPRPVAEYDLVDLAAQQGVDIIDNGGLGGGADIFLHDMVVKKMGDRYVMLADYWDAGYVTLDVTNPANPIYIADTTFDGADPLTGFEPQQGNGHQGEFSHDNRFILAADEEFAPYRTERITIADGPGAGNHNAIEVSGGTSPSFLPDITLNGPTVYGGYGCDASTPIPPRSTTLPGELAENEEAIVVLQRGPGSTGNPPVFDDPEGDEPACFPGEKALNGIEAGYDAVLLVNHHRGEDPDAPFCGSGDFPVDPPIVTVCTTHEAFHYIFDSEPNTEIPYDPAAEPDIGDLGFNISAEAVFDGWGYTHLYEAKTTPTGSKQVMQHIDAAAIEESLNKAYSFGFGDLSVHEFATDPTEYLAYTSYYSGGMRVYSFGPGGLVEQGRFIDDEGSNFWGVEQFTGSDGQRYFAGSDRDFGLQIFRYTGPGAAQRPVCTDSVTMVPFKSSGNVPLTCSDANGNPLTRAVTAQPTAGTLGAVGESVPYSHTGNSLGNADQFQFTANDGAATSAPATARIVAVPREGGRCFNPFAGSAARETLTGSPFGDRISGGDGNDTLNGRGGADCLSGERGADRISGGDGADRLTGGAGGDRVSGGRGGDGGNGGSGNDRASLGSGNDRYSGGGGRDRLDGGSGRDRLTGGGGNDQLKAGSGSNNRLSGGGGRDTLLAKNGARDRITCGAGRDTVRADRRDRVARDCERVRRR